MAAGGRAGTVLWKVFCPVMVYSLVVFLLLSVPVFYAASAAVRQLASDDNTFHDQIYNMTPLLLLHAHPLLPLLHWPEARDAAAYFNSWTKFEVRDEGGHLSTRQDSGVVLGCLP